MRIEKLSKGKNKKIILIITVLILTIGIIYITNSKAKYQVTKSVQIVNGKVNYSLADLNVIAMYEQIEEGNAENSNYKSINEIPKNGYKLNKEKSYCTEPNKNEELKNNMVYKNEKVSIDITKKGTKCYLYFDISHILKDDILTKELSKTGCPSQTNGVANVTGIESTSKLICETEDDYGISRYFRGTTGDNWVKFGQTTSGQDIWWRIIRINGNGTIRLIYAGITAANSYTAPSPIGDGTMIAPYKNGGSNYPVPNNGSFPNSIYFNYYYNDNKYVGYMYGTEKSGTQSNEGTEGMTDSYTGGSKPAHENKYDSDAKMQIDYWYEHSTNLKTLQDEHIDVNTGFCSDRIVSNANHGSPYTGTGKGYAKEVTIYAGADRVWASRSTEATNPQKATLKCGTDEASRKRDLFTGPQATSTQNSNGVNIEGNNKLKNPVAMITSDEVLYAGGFFKSSNNGYWLYTNKYYWTISPSNFNGSSAFVFYVSSEGSTNSAYVSMNNTNTGVRPVINLKADTSFTNKGTGTKGSNTNPYIVE